MVRSERPSHFRRRGRPRRSGRRAATALLLVSGVAACGGGTGRGTPTAITVPVAPSGVAPRARPPVATPIGAQLAVATSEGMEVWSPSTGVFTVGPAVRDVVASEVAWSPDGAYLSWQTVPAGRGRHGDELWYASVRTGVTEHWGPSAPGRAYGPVVVTDTGVLTLGAVIRRYWAADGVTVATPAGPYPTGAPMAAWLHGWVTGPVGGPARQDVRRLTVAGALLAPELVVSSNPVRGRRLDLAAVDAGGRELAAELGRQRAGCEVSGSAQLVVASLTHGAVHDTTPPTVVAGATQRFWNIDVSGPPGSVFASTFDCRRKGKARGRAIASVLWNYRAGRWHKVGPHLVAADELGKGPLATLGGDIMITDGVAMAVGEGAVSVDGQVVATGGQAIAWSPARAPTTT